MLLGQLDAPRSPAASLHPSWAVAGQLPHSQHPRAPNPASMADTLPRGSSLIKYQVEGLMCWVLEP